MSKDARNRDLDLSPEEQNLFNALVAMLAKRGFGEDGPPRETTFAQIEQFGHQAGRMVARAIDAQLADQHASHFNDAEPCPTCDEKCPSKESPHDLKIQTEDGEMTLHEPACDCPTCRREFFPSACSIED